jgi:hypothetical protein
MGSRYFQRPENAISKADEFIKVGKFRKRKDQKGRSTNMVDNF